MTRYDWTTLGQAPHPAQIDEMVDNIARAGFNTIFFQVRAAGDAYYTPGLEPWAARLTGSAAQSLGQDPGWDPLARMLEKAHAAGLELHAYVNVYTVWLPPPAELGGPLWPPATSPPHMFDRFTYGPAQAEHPGQYGLGYAWRHYPSPDKPMPLTRNNYLWASPGVDQVQDYSVQVITDVVTRYPVDGIHLDRIRYAGPGYSYDPSTNAVLEEEGAPPQAQWQRNRVTDLVRRVKEQVQAIRPALWLSAAVWPYYRDKWGWGVSEGYSDYYQDSKGWLAAGLADAITPMLYGGPADDIERWQIVVEDFLADGHTGHVYPGIGAEYDDFEAIARRIEFARRAGAGGYALFSYGALNRRDYWSRLATGPHAESVALPARP